MQDKAPWVRLGSSLLETGRHWQREVLRCPKLLRRDHKWTAKGDSFIIPRGAQWWESPKYLWNSLQGRKVKLKLLPLAKQTRARLGPAKQIWSCPYLNVWQTPRLPIKYPKTIKLFPDPEDHYQEEEISYLLPLIFIEVSCPASRWDSG